jgi:hypothetical protein
MKKEKYEPKSTYVIFSLVKETNHIHVMKGGTLPLLSQPASRPCLDPWPRFGAPVSGKFAVLCDV